jgi:radical SAM protein with 4Fe4S-binding SPASM domain
MAFACGAAIDVGPGLVSWNCFPLYPLHREHVLESDTTDELAHKFDAKMAERFGFSYGIFDSCGECKHFKRKVCRGGCKSFKTLEYA